MHCRLLPNALRQAGLSPVTRSSLPQAVRSKTRSGQQGQGRRLPLRRGNPLCQSGLWRQSDGSSRARRPFEHGPGQAGICVAFGVKIHPDWGELHVAMSRSMQRRRGAGEPPVLSQGAWRFLFVGGVLSLVPPESAEGSRSLRYRPSNRDSRGRPSDPQGPVQLS